MREKTESQAYREYFESILENLAVFDEMDVYGHIDYVVRYGPNKNQHDTYEAYRELLDEILKGPDPEECRAGAQHRRL